MRSGSWILVLLGPSLANTLSLEKRDAPAVLGLQFEHKESSNVPTATRLSKREDIFPLRIGNENVFQTNISIGSPPQSFDVIFQTVGNECWVLGGSSHVCTKFRGDNRCSGSNGYNKTLSTSVELVDSNFTAQESSVSTTAVTGELVTETVVVGNITLDSMKFGIIEDGITQNTLGLGYGDANSSFISFTQTLVDAGIIKSPAFSMYMDNPVSSAHAWEAKDARSGTLLFGGVNKSKYNGTLHTLPIVDSPEGLRRAYRVNMTGLSTGETSISTKNFLTQAVFDSSLPYTYVPVSIAQDIFSEFGITEIPTSGQITVPCNTTSSNTTMAFEFGAAQFKLNIGLFIDSNGMFGQADYDKEICYFGIVAKTDTHDANSVILGSNFLQQVYTVFDMENDEVSLAERNWNSTGDEILEITSGENAVPGTISEGDDTEKSVGTHIGDGTGLRLSLAVFVIWALFSW